MQNASSPIPGVPRVLTVSTLFKGSKSKSLFWDSRQTLTRELLENQNQVMYFWITVAPVNSPSTNERTGKASRKDRTKARQKLNRANIQSVLLLLFWHLAHMCHDVKSLCLADPPVLLFCVPHTWTPSWGRLVQCLAIPQQTSHIPGISTILGSSVQLEFLLHSFLQSPFREYDPEPLHLASQTFF